MHWSTFHRMCEPHKVAGEQLHLVAAPPPTLAVAGEVL
jgi:hypothetical protein